MILVESLIIMSKVECYDKSQTFILIEEKVCIALLTIDRRAVVWYKLYGKCHIKMEQCLLSLNESVVYLSVCVHTIPMEYG